MTRGPDSKSLGVSDGLFFLPLPLMLNLMLIGRVGVEVELGGCSISIVAGVASTGAGVNSRSGESRSSGGSACLACGADRGS